MPESIRSFDTGLTALAPFFGKSHQKDQDSSSLSIIESLLPKSAFLEEPCATGLTVERLEKFGPVEFLNLATFLISNNFPGETNGDQVYKWFKTNGNATVLKVIASTKGPASEALLENLFRLAIEAEDIPTAKFLIEAGVNPNGHICRHPRIPDHMNPLQYTCIRGNTELALELIKAGSSIDQPGTGWKSSALVLAIIGEHLRDYKDSWENREEIYLAESDQDLQEPTDRTLFLDLIFRLMDAGASVNPTVDRSSPTFHDWDGNNKPYLNGRLASFMQDGHSPLTAASKYRNKELVDFFLQHGADIDILTERGTSSLQECLYSWDPMGLDEAYHDGLTPLSLRQPMFPGSESLSTVMGVARSLIEAGADVDEDLLWCPLEEDDRDFEHCHTEEAGCYLKTLDLSVLIESVELVDIMLCAGASTSTIHSLEQAIKIGSFQMVNTLLNIGASLSPQAVRIAMLQHDSLEYIMTLLEKRPDVMTQKTIFFEAIRSGKNSILEYIFDYGNSRGRNLLHELDGIESSIEECCRSGRVDTLRLIIDKCSQYNVSISSHFGRSLSLAVFHGREDIMDTLLSAGADVNYVSSGSTALQVAMEKRNRKMISKLISANSILSSKTTDDEFEIQSSCVDYHEVAGDPLILAILWGDHSVIQELLCAGASIDALGSARRRGYAACNCITPLTAAIMKGDLILADALFLRGAAINNPVNSASASMTPLAAAIRSRNYKVVDSLIQRGANPWDSLALKEATSDIRLLHIIFTALYNWDQPPDGENIGYGALAQAIQEQNLEVIGALLGSPLKDINPLNRSSPALASALQHDSTRNLEIIRMILGRGVDPNSVWEFENNGSYRYVRSALCVAISQNNPEKVKVLLEAGATADDNLTLGMYDSPMQFAASLKSKDIIRILLEGGSDPNAVALRQGNYRNFTDYPKRDNGTPLQIAVNNQDIGTTGLLLKYNGNPNTIFGVMIHTPLQIASRDGSKELVELLLEHGAEVNAPPGKEFGATALQLAAMKGFLGIVHLLLEYEADVNAPPAEVDGRTALEGAAEYGRIDTVQLLLNAGANIFQDGEAQYENAVRRASENGHHAVRRLLESYHG